MKALLRMAVDVNTVIIPFGKKDLQIKVNRQVKKSRTKSIARKKDYCPKHRSKAIRQKRRSALP